MQPSLRFPTVFAAQTSLEDRRDRLSLGFGSRRTRSNGENRLAAMRTSKARAMSTSMAPLSQRPLDARRGKQTNTRCRTHRPVRAASYRPRAPSAAGAARATTTAKPDSAAHLKANERAAGSSGCPRGGSWHVHKFGGTCVGSPERILAAADLVRQQLVEDKPGLNRVLMVVSAMGTDPKTGVKTTDALLKAVELASKQDPASSDALEEVRQKHIQSATELLGPGEALDTFLKVLDRDCEDLNAMLKAIRISGSATDAFSDFVVGHGELWSAQMMCAALRMKGAKALWMDARDVLVVVPTSDNNSVDIKYRLSNENLDKWFDQHGVEEDTIIVATGFVARDPSGTPTTLKRNGSDYSATIMGALLLAGSITIWTDVNGVYSADPRKVSEAVSLNQLSYHEAWELSYFGANVLHPRTTLPAMKYNIPVIIRNFFDLGNPGTQISNFQTEEMDCRKAGQAAVKGFATIDDVAVISVEGTGMVGVPGTASAIFSTLRDANVNVVMISQASSEHSVCFCVKGADAPIAKQALAKKFESALASGRISKVEVIPDCTILAAVGQGMCARRGVAETLFSALANAGINIKAIAQGSSEYNITIVIDSADSVRALRAVHSRFYLSETPLAVGVVGPGLIGQTLLKQFEEQRNVLREEYNIDLRVLGVASTARMVLSDTGIDLERWSEEMDSRGEEADMQKFTRHVHASHVPNAVIIDCTASEAVSDYYAKWMEDGIHVVTPNKKLNSGPLARYKAVKELQKKSYTHFFYEGTVGAGLPIIATLKGLRETGDKVNKVEGIFSGTLSYLFNTMKPGMSFSEAVADAKANGYTEPDPRDDLAGMDVARKVVILARECGLDLELSDIPVESLVPEPLQNIEDVDEFMAKLPQYDADMEAKMSEASARGECLRYIGTVDVANRCGRVELQSFPASHPFTQLTGSDNIISFTTARYKAQPLIVRGPGAGAEVTAAGVFSDLLRLAAHLGAPS